MPASRRHLPIIAGASAGAWVLAIGAVLTGNAALLNHDILIEGGAPVCIALSLFLLGWQVLVAAMMLPASLPSIGAFIRLESRLGMP